MQRGLDRTVLIVIQPSLLILSQTFFQIRIESSAEASSAVDCDVAEHDRIAKELHGRLHHALIQGFSTNHKQG